LGDAKIINEVCTGEQDEGSAENSPLVTRQFSSDYWKMGYNNCQVNVKDCLFW